MAESAVNSGDNVTSEIPGKTEKMEPPLTREGLPAVPECAVCLQICVHPAQLPCSHIFCFLCLKGLATQGRRCAMCRQEIPPDYLDHPQLLEYPQTMDKDPHSYKWFYEGRNGWWQYDERTCNELETAYKNRQRTCDLLIAGTLYLANFDSMMQLQKNDRSRWRRIKRDLATVPKKGVAGLRIDVVLPAPSDSGDASSSDLRSGTENGASTSFTRYRDRRDLFISESESEGEELEELEGDDDEIVIYLDDEEEEEAEEEDEEEAEEEDEGEAEEEDEDEEEAEYEEELEDDEEVENEEEEEEEDVDEEEGEPDCGEEELNELDVDDEEYYIDESVAADSD